MIEVWSCLACQYLIETAQEDTRIISKKLGEMYATKTPEQS